MTVKTYLRQAALAIGIILLFMVMCVWLESFLAVLVWLWHHKLEH